MNILKFSVAHLSQNVTPSVFHVTFAFFLPFATFLREDAACFLSLLGGYFLNAGHMKL